MTFVPFFLPRRRTLPTFGVFATALGHATVALAMVASTAVAQSTAQATALSLGDAARLAAKQNGGMDIVRSRVDAANARVMQRRGALMPDVAAGIQQAGRTTNSATFGFAFKDAQGRPLLDPNGQLIGPIPTIDVRYRITQPLLDLGNYANTFFAGTGEDIRTNVRVQTVTALAGVSYKFGPSAVVAKY